MSRQSARYPPEVRDRAVQLVAKVRPGYESDQAAIQAVAGILGIDNLDELRKWVRREQINSHSGNYGSPKMRALKRSLFRTHNVIIGSIVVVLGGLGLLYSQQVLGVGQSSTPPQVPHLEVDQVEFGYASSALLAPVKIDIKLLNTGTQLAAINTAKLVIQDAIRLPVCAAQGGFTSTGLYKTDLPANPSAGQVVSIPVSQLVPADGADRFDLLLSVPMPRTSPGNLSIYLYRIHLYLTYNVHTSPVDVGEILVSFPVTPSGGDYFWSKYWLARPNDFNLMTRQAAPAVRACDIAGSYALRSILHQPAMRAAELAAIPSQLAY